jgi:hypothetical protein
MRLQKSNPFSVWLKRLTEPSRTSRVTLAAFAIVMMAFGPLAQVARADFVSLTINNGTGGSFPVGKQWLLTISSSFPSTTLNLCAIHPDGVQDCTPASALSPVGSTDVDGAWSLFGSLPANDPTVLGQWTEWAEFPSGAQSNKITFTVTAPVQAPSGTITINNTTSGGRFVTGDAWTLRVASNFLSSPFNLCAIHPNGVQDCTPTNGMFTNGVTDASGNWSGSGSFPQNDPTVLGQWTEWAQFPSGFTSIPITFTVAAPAVTPSASMTVNGATTGNFVLGQGWILHASSNLPSQNVLLCAIHPNGLQDCSTQVNGVPVPQTDANGNWKFSEWLRFPSCFTSTRISFTVVASASLAINGGSGGSFAVGQGWTLRSTSTFPNAALALCAIHPNGVQDCTPAGNLFPGDGSMDTLGNWSGSGAFSNADVGTWSEWAQFPSGFTSNHITFTVTAPAGTPSPVASLTINGVTNGTFSVGQTWTLSAFSNLSSQNVLLCGIHPNGVQDY